jgi:DNA sulfur modification protein DndE
LKFNLITVSTRSTKILSDLKTKTGLTPNISARFAICMSLKDRSVPNPDEFNKEGSKLEPDVLFGKHEQVYLALMLNRLKADRLDPELYLNEMTRAHLNRGVIALLPRINDLSNFYELVKEERHDGN